MKRLGIILLGATMLFAQPLSGQKLADPAFPDDSSITYTFAGTEFGRFGPYIGNFAYSGDNPVNIYCVDLYRGVSSGFVVTANVQNLADINGLVAPLNFLEGGAYTAGQLQESLKKAAWLSMKFWDPANYGDPAKLKALHYAVWSLTSGADISGSDAYKVAASNWVSLATANYMSYGNYSDWSLLTTTSAMYGTTQLTRSTQSMLVQSTTVTPEPETYLLMATGLIFLAFFGRRRFKENGYC
jgi:hypothetical protein